MDVGTGSRCRGAVLPSTQRYLHISERFGSAPSCAERPDVAATAARSRRKRLPQAVGKDVNSVVIDETSAGEFRSSLPFGQQTLSLVKVRLSGTRAQARKGRSPI